MGTAMKTSTMKTRAICAAALVGAMAFPSAQAQQVPFPKTAADVTGPLPGNIMVKEYVQMVGRIAYVWGYPMVNAHNRRAAFAKAPMAGLNGGVNPCRPGRPPRDVGRLRQTEPDLHCLPQSGRDIWGQFLRARQ